MAQGVEVMRPSYGTDARYWRRYQQHLPPSLRLTEATLPEEEWWPWRGGSVHLDRYVAPGAETTVVVLHGGGGYGRMLAPFGRALHLGGHEVVLPDLPGFGLTETHGGTTRYEDWVGCVVDLVQLERSRDRRVVLFGLSMGGMLALHAAAAALPDAVAQVIATTLMDPRTPEVRRGAGRVPTPGFALRSSWADRLRLPMPLLAPVEKMSSTTAINRLCLRDPQGGGRRVPLGLLRSWMTYSPAIEPGRFDRCPVVLAHPLADRWTPARWSQAVLDLLPGPTRFVGLENCEHLPIESPGLQVLLETLGSTASGAGSSAW